MPQNAIAALNALTTEGVDAFNQKYPQGLPQSWGGKGSEQVNGVSYYSWSGILQGKQLDTLDPTHGLLRALSRFFTTEPLQNDGMVGRYSSHLGTVIRSDYPLDHLGTLRQTDGQSERRIDPIDLYVQHAERLEKAGL
jgi:triacylglycerol lipase